jgi:hypothetical protein
MRNQIARSSFPIKVLARDRRIHVPLLYSFLGIADLLAIRLAVFKMMVELIYKMSTESPFKIPRNQSPVRTSSKLKIPLIHEGNFLERNVVS